MIERLPTPWGLVRLGVAPDHPKLKDVSRAFERIAERPGFRFFGNVELGRTITHEELTQLYDAVVYAVGAQTDSRLGIPGEDLPGSWSATEFVAWYNGHPDFQELEFDLSVERAVVVGRATSRSTSPGCSRSRTKSSIRPMRPMRRSRRSRRPASARSSCSGGAARRRPPSRTPELKELGELAGADIVVDPARARARCGERSRDRRRHERDAEHGRAARLRRAQAQREAASARAPLPRLARRVPRRRAGRGRRGRRERARRVERPDRRARDRAPRDDPAGIVFRSVGYRGVELPGLPFDPARGTLPNDCGRVLDGDGSPLAGVYCAGWIKRGPTGVIGTNKKDATETVGCCSRTPRPAGCRGQPTRATSSRRWWSGTASRSSTRAGRRSTRPRRQPAKRAAVRGSSSAPGTSCLRAANL